MKYKKESGYEYFFAGSGCSAGSMVCATCQKSIDNATDDWMASQKSLPNYDWKYVCRHRACAKSEAPWEVIIKKKQQSVLVRDEIIECFHKYKSANGDYTPEFYAALELCGIDA